MSEFWLEGCESPLEEAFRVGMNQVLPFKKHPRLGSIEWGFWSVWPQFKIGDSRVDLLIHGPVSFVVELDGNRYHAGQARILADVERERRIVAAGHNVLRFQGPEVFSDPKARATDLAEILDAHIDVWNSNRRGELQLPNPYILRPWPHTRVP